MQSNQLTLIVMLSASQDESKNSVELLPVVSLQERLPD